ncbi:MAG: L-aspartate oxidase [Planctomycetota bacterium]|nr:L-aspartate oxidase [Planctomycetota bacterium]
MDNEVRQELKPDLGKIVRYGPSRLYCPHLDRDDIIETDVLVLGCGAAGLMAAIRAAENSRVLVISKTELSESNTVYAQGGIAGALAEDDTVENHMEDTFEGGYGLNRKEVVQEVVEEGPKLIEQLAAHGTRFDRDDGAFNLTREGGHQEKRVLHALGDRTGWEMERALIAWARENDRITLVENTFAIDLLTDGGKCMGALVFNDQRRFKIISARTTVLATGGLCQVYRETSNPENATGDGIAMAYRAGARMEDMEFVQFHPTTLYMAGAPRFLISEAARGEGAHLLNVRKERFMQHYHKMAELAPRDVVSRAILAEQEKTRSSSVYLDMTRLGDKVHERFPQISKVLKGFDIDISKDLIPVYPGAHYAIGGVKIDLMARTTLDNLYSCGEAAATGFHGANRLGSNSLLESIVFGARAGKNASATATGTSQPPHSLLQAVCESGEKVDTAYPHIKIDLNDARISLKSLMWRHVGILRDREGLESAMAKVKFWARYMIYRRFTTKVGWELQNMLMVSRLIVDASLTREESRGVHHRTDHQSEDPDWQRHIYMER